MQPERLPRVAVTYTYVVLQQLPPPLGHDMDANSCALQRLSLSNADVDDDECNTLMEVLCVLGCASATRLRLRFSRSSICATGAVRTFSHYFWSASGLAACAEPRPGT